MKYPACHIYVTTCGKCILLGVKLASNHQTHSWQLQLPILLCKLECIEIWSQAGLKWPTRISMKDTVPRVNGERPLRSNQVHTTYQIWYSCLWNVKHKTRWPLVTWHNTKLHQEMKRANLVTYIYIYSSYYTAVAVPFSHDTLRFWSPPKEKISLARVGRLVHRCWDQRHLRPSRV